MSEGRLSCKKVSTAQAKQILKKNGIPVSELKTTFRKYAIELRDWSPNKPARFLKNERTESETAKSGPVYKICTDSRKPYGLGPSSAPKKKSRGGSAAKSFFGSKAGIGLTAAVVGFIVGKVV